MMTHPRRHRKSQRLTKNCYRILTAVVVSAALVAEPVSAAPEFVTQPSDIYEQYTALKEPRADLPVGALWVQDYGPHGEGAAADNLVTVRSLSGVALSGDMQLRLTLGLAALLNLEPGYSRRISARFTDISIVRVKELGRLSGPAGEPRIYEALKAGTINITTDRDIGLDVGGALEVKKLPVVARADSGGKKSFTIDGRDLFIAFRVAASLPSRSEQKEAVLKYGGRALEVPLRDYRLRLEWPRQAGSGADDGANVGRCSGPADLVLYRGSRDGDVSKVEMKHVFDGAPPAQLELPLPVPVADGNGGLLTKLVVARGVRAPATAAGGTCVESPLRLSAWLEGARLKSVSDPQAPSW